LVPIRAARETSGWPSSNPTAQPHLLRGLRDEAIAVVARHANSTPAGVGVDAPLCGHLDVPSDRQADQW